jgi:hypothetical protein
MKELAEKKQDKTEVHAVKPVEKQLTHIGSLRPQPGQKVFEYNAETHEIHEAKFEEVAAVYGQEGVRKKLLVQPNHAYACAINKKNAHKRLCKLHGVTLKWTNK